MGAPPNPGNYPPPGGGYPPNPGGLPPNPSAFFTPPPPQKKKPVALVALVALVVLCGLAVAVLVVMATGEDSESEASEKGKEETKAAGVSRSASDLPTEEPVEGEEEAAGEAQEQITIVIETEPTGAEVFRESESVGITKLEKEFPKGSGSETWQIFADGFDVAEVKVSLDSDGFYEVKLKETTTEAPAETSASEASAGGGSDSADDEGDDGTSTAKKRRKKRKKGRKVMGTTGGSASGFDIPD